MEEKITIYMIGMVSIVTIVGLILTLLISNSRAASIQESYGYAIRMSQPAVYAPTQTRFSDQTSALKECVKAKMEQAKYCSQDCMTGYGTTTSAVRGCLDSCKQSFNVAVRACEQYAPASAYGIVTQCNTKTDLNEYISCMKVGAQAKVEPIRDCLDLCKSQYSSTQDIAGARSCADSCLANI